MDPLEEMNQFGKELFAVIKNQFEGLNLVGHRKYENFFREQIEDTVSAYKQCPLFKSYLHGDRPIVDLGTGGGFPLLPLCRLRQLVSGPSPVRCIGIDSREKKVLAVNKILQSFQIEHIGSATACRIEKLLFDTEVFICLKAVGRPERLLPMIIPTPGTEATVCFFSTDKTEEIKSIIGPWRFDGYENYELSGERYRRLEYFVPRGTMSSRKTPNVPRGTIYLSSLL